jgi:ABC-type antimicrobial peptide transport system permease subunit
VLLGIFGLAALLLASIGLYGVMANLVAQRTREIAIRIALGGQARVIRRMVVGEGLIISLTGLAIGTALSLAATRLLSSLLFGVTPTDVTTFAAVASLLLAVALIAAYGPARHATRIDPMTALRESLALGRWGARSSSRRPKNGRHRQSRR